MVRSVASTYWYWPSDYTWTLKPTPIYTNTCQQYTIPSKPYQTIPNLKTHSFTKYTFAPRHVNYILQHLLTSTYTLNVQSWGIELIVVDYTWTLTPRLIYICSKTCQQYTTAHTNVEHLSHQSLRKVKPNFKDCEGSAVSRQDLRIIFH